MTKEVMDNVKVFILCGGKGKRLKNISQHVPKALVPVNGRPILEYSLTHFLKQGFNLFIFGTGYLSEQIENFAREFNPKIEYVVSNAGSNISMLERICHAQTHFSDDVIVCYGDTFIDLDYQALFKEHQKSGAALTIVTGKIQNPFGVVTIDLDNLVTSFVEKPIYDHYIGCFAFKRQALEMATSEMRQKSDGQGLVEFFKLLSQKNQLRAYRHEGFSVTFNTAKELEDAQKNLKDYYTLNELQD